MSLHFLVTFTSDLEPPRSILVIAYDRRGAERLAKQVLTRDIGDERASCFQVRRIELRSPESALRGAA